MIQTIVIILFLVLTATICSCLVATKSKQQQRWQGRIRRVRSRIRVDRNDRNLYALGDGEEDEDLEGLHSYFIGEISCRYNARSPYVRCAVKPSGPCENCHDYESRY